MTVRRPRDHRGDVGGVDDGDRDVVGPLPGTAGGGDDEQCLSQCHELRELRLGADLRSGPVWVGPVEPGPPGDREVRHVAAVGPSRAGRRLVRSASLRRRRQSTGARGSPDRPRTQRTQLIPGRYHRSPDRSWTTHAPLGDHRRHGQHEDRAGHRREQGNRLRCRAGLGCGRLHRRRRSTRPRQAGGGRRASACCRR